MSDKKSSKLPFDGDNAEELALWNALGEITNEDPSPQLRQGFYRELEKASRPSLASRLQEFLGFSGNNGWITATACVLVGLGAGQLVNAPDAEDGVRLAALEENVSMLNRNLILDRLDNDIASKRLRGVMDAAVVAGDDSQIADALLQLATQDRVPSVRSAAINALGTQLGAPEIGRALMEMLVQVDSPLVQMALVDLVLRNGDAQQIEQLQKLADDGSLHPDLASHVIASVKGDLI